MTQLEVIVPVYNEAENISDLFFRLDKTLTQAKIDYKIIFVDDNSTDNTVDEIKNLPKSRVELLIKKNKKGKAFSILEGLEASVAPVVAMIDGDLQYPPEAIPEMYSKILSDPNLGMVVANRKSSKSSKFRRFLSKFNRFVVGKLLLGLNFDIQSGLKVFRRGIASFIDSKKVSGWSLDVPLLHMTRELGYQISQVDIEFADRTKGQTKVKVFEVASQIVFNGLSTRLSKRKIYHLPSDSEDSMVGAGVAYKKHRFTTHTTLHHSRSAITVLNGWQKVGIMSLLVILCALFFKWPLPTAIALVAFLSTVYFIDTVFNLFLVLKSLHFPPEISFSKERLDALNSKSLPVYSILCPLYKEAGVLPHFLDSISKLDWPKEKLDVLLLLEQDDVESIDIISKMDLPKYIRTIVVPDSQPKTKPKACNYGLAFVKGEYVVIYDAEDRPDADQLKKAYLGFQNVGLNVGCLQAKLNYYNPHHNLLTRLFTAEYSLWFDVILTGLQSIETAIPLGGTSNHFRTETLKRLEGWDPFNVTEDCDLGIRLFKYGYKTAIIDSTTLEEANSKVGNWIRQRSRWIKGYIQTYLVQMRNPFELVKTQGWHAVLFQLTVGGKIAFIFINPLLWIATISYFLLYKFVGPTIESLYPPVIFYMAITSLVFGNFFFLYYYMIGCAKREHWQVIKYVFLIPIYWLMVSIAGFKALIQLIYKPHYWEKTNHGLINLSPEVAIINPRAQSKTVGERLAVSGGILVFASMLANFLNFLGSTFLTRSSSISFSDLGILGFIASITTISDVVFGAISKTITFKTAFLLGKHGRIIKNTWNFAFKISIILGLVVSLTWFVSAPLLSKFFSSPVFPLLITAPVWFFTVLTAINNGFLSGAHKFAVLATFLVVEAITKLLVTIGLVHFGRADLVYLALPISLGVSAIVGSVYIFFIPKNKDDNTLNESKRMSLSFFTSSLMLKAAGVLFLSMDVVIAKHFLAPDVAGQYVLLSTIGKMVYFFGSLFTSFINPLVSRNEGAERSSTKVFNISLILTVLANLIPIIFIGLLGPVVIPLLFSTKSLSITDFLLWYTFAMAFFSIAGVLTNYHLAKRHHLFSVVSLVLAVGQSIALVYSAHSIWDFVTIVLISSAINLISVFGLHILYNSIISVYENFKDFLLVFKTFSFLKEPVSGKRVLILNWRDTKHAWAGGAEVYVHELAKRWVREGNQVVMFSGHDRRTSRNETVDGVIVIRRGGFSLVYLWSAIYYLLHFRGKFDVIIDCTNGLPFFTPLYSKAKKFLLIHHVNQDIFRQGLFLPLYHLAWFLEAKLMPIVYKNVQVVTVSESSKQEIIQHKLTKSDPIVIHNGVDLNFFVPGVKSEKPLVLYLGRLQKHKSIDVFIKAAQRILNSRPDVEFVIAGDGPEKDNLMKFVTKLGLSEKIKFLGKVLEEEKRRLFQSAWVFVNPSLKEGWGITSIEANACGTPVVASNVSGLRDSVKNPHTGFLVEYGDEEGFAEKILKLIEDHKLRKEMSDYSVEWAKQFGWETSAQEFGKVIKI